MSYQARVLNDPEEIADLGDAWRRCQAAYKASHFQQDPDWLRIEIELASREAMRPAVAVLYQDREVVGVAPFRVLPRKIPCRIGYFTPLRFSLLVADLCGETLMTPGNTEAQEDLLCALLEGHIPHDSIFLESVPMDSLLWRTLSESSKIRKKYWLFTPDPPTVHHLLRLGTTMEEYLEKFSRDGRRKLRNSSRKLKDASGGDLELQRVTERAAVPDLMRDVEELSRKGWKGTTMGRVVKATDEAARFCLYADRGWLRCYLLKAKGQPIAFRTCVQMGGSIHLLETAYDPAWRSSQPGKVLLYMMIEDLFAWNKPEVLDFGSGHSAHKQFFATQSFPETNAYLLRKGGYTGLARVTLKLCSSTTLQARALLDRLGLREKVRQLLRRTEPADSAP